MSTTRTFGTFIARAAEGDVNPGAQVQFFAIGDTAGATPISLTPLAPSTGGAGTVVTAGANGEVKFSVEDPDDDYTEGWVKSGSGPLQYVRAQGKMAGVNPVFEVIWDPVAEEYPTPPATAPDGTVKRIFTGPVQPAFDEWDGVVDAWDVWNPA